MSWQEYVDSNLMCADLESAALLGHDGSVWAQSPAFPSVTEEQAAVVMKTFSGTFPEGGSFLLGDVKFMLVGSDDAETKLRGKCAGGGCSISKTTKALVVGIWAENRCQASKCNQVVETLGEYLVSVSF